MKLFPHFKRRVNDTVQMIKECYSQVTWKNFIWTIPGTIFLTLFVSFWMIFEDYEEIDAWERKIEKKLRESEELSESLPEKEWTTLRNFKGNDDNVEYNYFKISHYNGEVYGYCAAEKGSDNEVKVFESCMDMGLKLEKVSKEEYDEAEKNRE